MLNHGWTYREQVDRSGAGLTLLAYYSQRYAHSSPEEWQDRIAAGQVLLDDRPATTDVILRPGQRLTYQRPPWEEPEVPLSFEVLYEDLDLLIVAKPSGLPVLPGGGFLEHTLLRQLQRQYPADQYPADRHPGTPVPIHRLGRGTSGLMLMARSPLAKSHLSQQMRDRQIHKTYRALVGSGFPDRLIVTDAIGKIPHPVLGYIYAATPDGQFAHSECQVLRRNSGSTLLEVTILTGRPHQIRIHLAAAGYPLLGDPLYGIGGVPHQPEAEKVAVPGDCGYWLHAYHLGFHHPRTGEVMSVICPPPSQLC